MGYKYELVNGLPEMTWEQDDTIFTDMLLSCYVEQQSFFLDPEFGLQELPKNMTAQTPALVQQRFARALQWLLDTGRATALDVIAEPDLDNRDRVKVLCKAVQSNGIPVEYETFVSVV